MSYYGILAVRFNDAAIVESAVICAMDVQNNEWVGSPCERPAHEIADLITAGDTVIGIFTNGAYTVPGPKFRRHVFGGGIEGIELDEDVPGKRLENLVQIIGDGFGPTW